MKNDKACIDSLEQATAVIAHEAQRCMIALESMRKSPPDQLTSCFGGTFWGTADESWPLARDDRPLIPLVTGAMR